MVNNLITTQELSLDDFGNSKNLAFFILEDLTKPEDNFNTYLIKTIRMSNYIRILKSKEKLKLNTKHNINYNDYILYNRELKNKNKIGK